MQNEGSGWRSKRTSKNSIRMWTLARSDRANPPTSAPQRRACSRVWVAMLVGLVSMACGGQSYSFWLTSPNPRTATADRGCWDGCRKKYRDGTMEVGNCVKACPGIERRPVDCPEAEREQCVDDSGGAIAIILIAGITIPLGILLGILVAALI